MFSLKEQKCMSWILILLQKYLMVKPTKGVSKRWHMDFLGMTENKIWLILMQIFFQFLKLLYSWNSLGLYHIGPIKLNFHNSNPWSQSAFCLSGHESSSWGPGFGPRAKLYIVSNTSRYIPHSFCYSLLMPSRQETFSNLHNWTVKI